MPQRPGEQRKPDQQPILEQAAVHRVAELHDDQVLPVFGIVAADGAGLELALGGERQREQLAVFLRAEEVVDDHESRTAQSRGGARHGRCRRRGRLHHDRRLAHDRSELRRPERAGRLAAVERNLQQPVVAGARRARRRARAAPAHPRRSLTGCRSPPLRRMRDSTVRGVTVTGAPLALRAFPPTVGRSRTWRSFALMRFAPARCRPTPRRDARRPAGGSSRGGRPAVARRCDRGAGPRASRSTLMSSDAPISAATVAAGEARRGCPSRAAAPWSRRRAPQSAAGHAPRGRRRALRHVPRAERNDHQVVDAYREPPRCRAAPSRSSPAPVAASPRAGPTSPAITRPRPDRAKAAAASQA